MDCGDVAAEGANAGETLSSSLVSGSAITVFLRCLASAAKEPKTMRQDKNSNKTADLALDCKNLSTKTLKPGSTLRL